MKKFLVEVRELDGSLSSTAKMIEAKKAFPFFFSKRGIMSMDDLMTYFSKVNGKWVPARYDDVVAKMKELHKTHGIFFRKKDTLGF
jgi:hypothetical protein